MRHIYQQLQTRREAVLWTTLLSMLAVIGYALVTAFSRIV